MDERPKSRQLAKPGGRRSVSDCRVQPVGGRAACAVLGLASQLWDCSWSTSCCGTRGAPRRAAERRAVLQSRVSFTCPRPHTRLNGLSPSVSVRPCCLTALWTPATAARRIPIDRQESPEHRRQHSVLRRTTVASRPALRSLRRSRVASARAHHRSEHAEVRDRGACAYGQRCRARAARARQR